MPSSRTLHRRAAWSAPVLTAAVVGAVAVLPSFSASASPHPSLSAKSAAQLLTDVQKTATRSLSGTVVTTTRLGLPSLPGSGNTSALTPASLLTGSHTVRVWVDGADKQRLAVLGQLSESDVVHNGKDLWTYSSTDQKVGHKVFASSSEASTASKETDTYTPAGATAELLKAIDPSTAVTVDRTARVAGRAAYTLVLTPKTPGTTIRRVLVAIDSKTSVPLRVQVFAAGTQPAFETAFSSVSFATPAASDFSFTVPKGATVSSSLLTGLSSKKLGKPKVLGEDWTSVLELPGAGDGTSALASLISDGSAHHQDTTTALVGRLTKTLPNGDQLLTTDLVNVLITTKGTILLGAVTPAVLEQAAGKLG